MQEFNPPVEESPVSRIHNDTNNNNTVIIIKLL